MLGHTSNYISGLRIRKLRLLKKAGAFGLVFLVSAFAFLYVWQRVQVIKAGYEVEALKKQKDELARTNKALQIEVATLASPDRIEAIAAGQMGMKTPDESQVLLVKRMVRGSSPLPDGSKRVSCPRSGPGNS